LIDWSFGCNANKTKQATALAHANVYAGKEMEFFELYPRLMNIAIIAMLYGFAMPLFFLMTFLIFSASYVIDKLMLTFFW